jgi:hypothetical protein
LQRSHGETPTSMDLTTDSHSVEHRVAWFGRRKIVLDENEVLIANCNNCHTSCTDQVRVSEKSLNGKHYLKDNIQKGTLGATKRRRAFVQKYHSRFMPCYVELGILFIITDMKICW